IRRRRSGATGLRALASGTSSVEQSGFLSGQPRHGDACSDTCACTGTVGGTAAHATLRLQVRSPLRQEGFVYGEGLREHKSARIAPASVRLGFHIGVAPLPARAEEREIGGLLVGVPGDLLEVKRQAQAGTLGDL